MPGVLTAYCMDELFATVQFKPTPPRQCFVIEQAESHPFAEDCGLPPSTDDVALRLSIEDLGTLEPITLYEDKVLDGRARLRVNQQLGRSVEVEHFEDTDTGKAAAARGKGALDDAALAYVFDKNLVRRHLTDTQRAVLAFRRANMRQGERTDLLEPSAAWRKVSQADAADAFR